MTKTLKCISPIDGSVFAERPVLSLDDAQAVAAFGAMNDEIVP